MDGLTVTRLAREAGVNRETIRYYERRGLLPRPPRSSGGYRIFPLGSVPRVRFVKRVQELGFTLADARELLQLRDHPDAACPQVREKAARKLEDINKKVRELKAMHRDLTRLAAACAQRGGPHSCPFLDILENDAPGHSLQREQSSQKTRANNTGRKRARRN